MTSNSRDWTSAIRQHARASGLELSGDVVEELAVHLEDLYLRALAEGQTAAAADQAALATLSSATLPQLAHRQRARPERQSRLMARVASTSGALTGVAFDLSYALRLVRRQPMFSCALIGLLALSIGAASAVFSVVDAVLLRPLPYSHPDRLMVLSRIDKLGRVGPIASGDWLDYAQRVSAFEAVAVHANWTMNLAGDAATEPMRLRSQIASSNFFAVFGVAPALGRVFGDADDRVGAPPVAVISDGLWTRRFGRDPGVVNRTMTINARPVTVIGVMPASFAFPSPATDLWMPLGIPPEVRADRASEWLRAVARLRAGVSIDAALQEAQALSAALAVQYPVTNAGEKAGLVPLLDSIVGTVRPALLIVAGAVVFVFLVTCLNAANLLLARASVRQDDMAVRLAIGANSWRLVRQVLAESAVLTIGAATVGVVIAWALLRGIVVLGMDRIPRLADVGLHGLSIAAAAAVCGVMIGCGGVAATLALRRSSGHALARGGVRLARSQGLRPVLLAAQIACSFVLVTAALLLAASYARVQQVPAGFESTDVLSLMVSLPRQKYPDSAAHIRFADAVVRELAAAPGVAAVGVVNDLPLAGNQMSFPIAREADQAPSGPPSRATVRLTSPGYFDVLRIPVLEGRPLSSDDVAGREPVVVVNRSAAAQYWPTGAVGQRVRIGEGREWLRIAGVVGDIRHAGLETEEGAVIYMPYAQKPLDFVNWLGIVVRGPSAASLVRSVKARIAAVDPAQPVYDVMLVDDYFARARAPYRLNSWIIGGLAALSLLLAVAGVFALATYMAAARRQEFGIRLALGSSNAGVLRLMLGQVLKLVIIGTIAGAAGAFLAASSLTALLFQMTPHDPRVFAAVAALFIGAALLAALGPALRASRVDPATAIRAE